MKKQSKQSKVSIRRFLCVSLLIVGISTFSSMRINATTVSYDPLSYSSLTPHDPISITSDSDFEVFPGSGTVEDPYVIEGYNITTISDEGIYISGTTKYFIVRNCYVDAESIGIYIYDVADGTATVINNTCSNYSDNDYGILLSYSGSSTIANNTCNRNYRGIYFEDSDFCVVTYNLLRENEGYGVYFWYGSDSNLIHHNTFVDNNLGGTSQAFDDGTNNTWYDTEKLEGNYWSDWSGIGSYYIGGDGEADSVDLYPLGEPVVVEYPQIVLLTLILSIVTLFLTRTISKKVKKE